MESISAVIKLYEKISNEDVAHEIQHSFDQ